MGESPNSTRVPADPGDPPLGLPGFPVVRSGAATGPSLNHHNRYSPLAQNRGGHGAGVQFHLHSPHILHDFEGLQHVIGALPPRHRTQSGRKPQPSETPRFSYDQAPGGWLTRFSGIDRRQQSWGITSNWAKNLERTSSPLAKSIWPDKPNWPALRKSATTMVQ